jgi:hypothetical protein
MRRPKKSTSGERQIAVPGSVVLGVLGLFIAWLWLVASPGSEGEVWAIAPDGTKLYQPMVHAMPPRRTLPADDDDDTAPLPPTYVRAWQLRASWHQH